MERQPLKRLCQRGRWRAFAPLAFMLVVVLAPSSWAQDAGVEGRFEGQPVRWSAHCRAAEQRFEVVVTSASGEPAEEDQTLWVAQAGQRPLRVNAEPGKFAPSALVPGLEKGKGPCEGVGSVGLAGGWVMIVLALDLGPGGGGLAVLRYAPERHCVEGWRRVTEPVSAEPSPLLVRPVLGGVAYHAVRSFRGDAVGARAWRSVRWLRGRWVERWMEDASPGK